jgi:CheY-like chemotaxis protein
VMNRPSDHVTVERARVLVLASPDIALSLQSMLRTMRHLDLVVPKPGPGEEGRLGWLCRQLFSIDPACAANQDAANFFLWAGFDFVILQDEWLSDSHGAPRMELAGRTLAGWDNSRGNFSTRKIVLGTDKSLFALRVAGGLADPVENLTDEWLQRIGDPKRSIEYVDLNGPFQTGFGRMRELLCARETLPRVADTAPAPEQRVNVDLIREAIARAVNQPVLAAAAAVMRKLVASTADVVLVEDEIEALRDTFGALTHRPLDVPPDLEPGIRVVTLGSGAATVAPNFAELLTLACERTIDALQKRKDDHEYVLVVTDILFDLASPNENGIELIRVLRGRYKDKIGIVAYTGFDTPFVAMSAYLNGADYVVLKRPARGSHDWVRFSGGDLLLEALAFLCLQRIFLRAIRSSCSALLEEPASDVAVDQQSRALQQYFERSLPQHTISLHLQQEWEDTHYVLKLMQIVPNRASLELRAALAELRQRYA